MFACGQLLLRLGGDNVVLDLVVGGLREDSAGDKLILRSIGTAIDNALGVCVADAWKSLELVGSRGVDVDLVGSGGGCGGGSRLGRRGLLPGHRQRQREQE